MYFLKFFIHLYCEQNDARERFVRLFFFIGKFLKCTKTLMLMAIVNRPAPQTVMLMCSANALGPISQMYHMDYVSTLGKELLASHIGNELQCYKKMYLSWVQVTLWLGCNLVCCTFWLLAHGCVICCVDCILNIQLRLKNL